MGNYSSVILLWSGIDRKAEPHGDRLAAIVKKANEHGLYGSLFMHMAWENGHGPCEVVAVGICKSFQEAPLLGVLESMEWDYPDEVELLWKSEDCRSYQVIRPFGYEALYACDECGWRSHVPILPVNDCGISHYRVPATPCPKCESRMGYAAVKDYT